MLGDTTDWALWREEADNDPAMALFGRRVRARQIKSTTDFQTALSEGKPVLVDFWKPDCQPCRVMDGIVDELADEFGDRAVVLKANLQHVPDLFERFKVRSTPTFVLVTTKGNGLHQRFRQSGLVKKDQLTVQLQRAVDSI